MSVRSAIIILSLALVCAPLPVAADEPRATPRFSPSVRGGLDIIARSEAVCEAKAKVSKGVKLSRAERGRVSYSGNLDEADPDDRWDDSEIIAKAENDLVLDAATTISFFNKMNAMVMATIGKKLLKRGDSACELLGDAGEYVIARAIETQSDSTQQAWHSLPRDRQRRIERQFAVATILREAVARDPFCPAERIGLADPDPFLQGWGLFNKDNAPYRAAAVISGAGADYILTAEPKDARALLEANCQKRGSSLEK